MRMSFQVCQTAKQFSMHLTARIKVEKKKTKPDLHSIVQEKDRDRQQILPKLVSTV